jgi:hypothetical protein
MAQIVPRDTIGGRLGAGLSTGLEQLAQLKMNQYANRQMMQQSQSRLQNVGLAPEEAAYVATLPPQQQFEVVQALFRAGGGQEQPQQLQQQPMMPQEGMGSLQSQQNQSQQGASTGLKQLSPQTAQQPNAQVNAQPQAQQAPQVPDFLKNPLSSKEVAKRIVEAQQQMQQAQPKKPGLREALAAPTRKEQFELQKRMDKEQFDLQKRVDTETKKYYDEVLASGDVAKKADLRLNRMEKLINNGKLPKAGWYNFWNKIEDIGSSGLSTAGGAIGGIVGGLVGLPAAVPSGGLGTIPAAIAGRAVGATVGGAIGSVAGAFLKPVASLIKAVQRNRYPDTEEFEKLSLDFIKDAKSIFGAKITDADLAAFMQTVPTLSQTDQGKLKIINNMRSFNKANEIKAKALKDIIRENKGKRPANIQILVEERAKPELDEIAQEFQSR